MVIQTIIIFIQSIFLILCLGIGFLFGFKLGQRVARATTSENGKTQIIEPIVKKNKQEKMSKEEKQKYEEEIAKMEQVWKNITDYDGTAKNQRKVDI